MPPSLSGPFNNSPCKLPLPPEDHASALRFSHQTHVVNNMGVNINVSAATPVQVVDKFIPEHSLQFPHPLCYQMCFQRLTALHVLARKPSAFASKSELGTREKFIYPWIYVEPEVKCRCSSGMSKRCCCDTNQVLIGLAGKLWHAIVKTIPGHKAVYEKKLLHMQAVVIVKLLWDQILLLEDSQITDIQRSPSQVLFIATEFGVVELVVELIQSYPDLIWRVDEDSRSIFHIAVIHRQEKIFRLINGIGAHKDMIVAYKDENKNNHCILHLAAKIAPPNRLNIVSGGNDNDRGTPIYLESESFIVFAMADAFALFSSVTSILMFLSILTSPYAEEDFFRLLPQRLIVGLATLFMSIAAMLVAFGATFCIVLSQKLAWIAVPTAFIACIPVTLFAFLQFPLLVDVIQSSYGAAIFA
ncbi:Ankyrin repeat-containing protein, putative isoform 2 [Hibiscus syriacus]|uniref:Ankyrin repeat-containing protein, putative isoform 2 n=1 Tax=Hibiscus syriacus TaxID=106335 RepID=A0A6A3B0H4_HIBSY|nr:Ankyrin repeat-containing protein, putative isoform 2 [Hibiscus syriacus]